MDPHNHRSHATSKECQALSVACRSCALIICHCSRIRPTRDRTPPRANTTPALGALVSGGTRPLIGGPTPIGGEYQLAHPSNERAATTMARRMLMPFAPDECIHVDIKRAPIILCIGATARSGLNSSQLHVCWWHASAVAITRLIVVS